MNVTTKHYENEIKGLKAQISKLEVDNVLLRSERIDLRTEKNRLINVLDYLGLMDMKYIPVEKQIKICSNLADLRGYYVKNFMHDVKPDEDGWRLKFPVESVLFNSSWKIANKLFWNYFPDGCSDIYASNELKEFNCADYAMQAGFIAYEYWCVNSDDMLIRGVADSVAFVCDVETTHKLFSKLEYPNEIQRENLLKTINDLYIQKNRNDDDIVYLMAASYIFGIQYAIQFRTGYIDLYDEINDRLWGWESLYTDKNSIELYLKQNGVKLSKSNPALVVPDLTVARYEENSRNLDALKDEMSILSEEKANHQFCDIVCQVAYESGILSVLKWRLDSEKELYSDEGCNYLIDDYGSPTSFEKAARECEFYNDTIDILKPIFKKYGHYVLDKWTYDTNDYWSSALSIMVNFYLLGLQAALPLLGEEYRS